MVRELHWKPNLGTSRLMRHSCLADTTPACFDPIGPWNLESTIKLPDCSTKINFSTIHDKANINVSHILKIMLRVERGDDDFMDSKGKRKVSSLRTSTGIRVLISLLSQLWDVIIEVRPGPGPRKVLPT